MKRIMTLVLTVFVAVLASPSGAASGSWSVQAWQELADWIKHIQP